jgi:phage gp36-like protein
MGPGGAPYVTYLQLSQYVPAAVLSLATVTQQQQACLDATETADSYMRGRYNMPLLAWGNDVTRYTAYIAVFLLLSGAVGFAPQAGADVNVTRNYQAAVGGIDPVTNAQVVGWFEKIQRQAIQPDVTPSIAIGMNSGVDLPQVQSNPPRGWMQFRNGKPVIGGF